MKKKKKDRAAKNQEGPEFSFKEFTPEESRIYEEAVTTYREAVAAGKTLRQAYESYAIADSELQHLIQADFLKIVIAERHFGLRQSFDEIARNLDVSIDLLKETHARMLQEVGMTAADQFSKEYGSVAPSVPETND